MFKSHNLEGLIQAANQPFSDFNANAFRHFTDPIPGKIDTPFLASVRGASSPTAT
jgi:hypothetical protein